MATTDDMALLIDRLHTDPTTKSAFAADRRQAIANYDLTTHERDAILTSDCDDLVALGLATSVSALPDALGCSEREGPRLPPGLIDRIRDSIEPLRDRLPIPDRLNLPRPFRRRPEPPTPQPEPPRPRPTPGPDPPRPERRGGG